ncbi:MAG TPA: hypothetical protein VMU48_00945 [Terracidiphilus sp.]|nr:hypothetical protein [Terracidiphilus sp.]
MKVASKGTDAKQAALRQDRVRKRFMLGPLFAQPLGIHGDR